MNIYALFFVKLHINDVLIKYYFNSRLFRLEEGKSRTIESSKSDKKHKKKHKKEKHKKSSKTKKEKRKKRHHQNSSDSDENIKRRKVKTSPVKKLLTPPTIDLDDDLSPDEIEKSKEIFSKLVGKRDNPENGNQKPKRPPILLTIGGESKSKKPKISTDPDELVNIIKKTIETDIPAVVSSASDSEG